MNLNKIKCLLIALILFNFTQVKAKGYWETYKEAYNYCASTIVGESSGWYSYAAASAVCADTYMKYNFHPNTTNKEPQKK